MYYSTRLPWHYICTCQLFLFERNCKLLARERPQGTKKKIPFLVSYLYFHVGAQVQYLETNVIPRHTERIDFGTNRRTNQTTNQEIHVNLLVWLQLYFWFPGRCQGDRLGVSGLFSCLLRRCWMQGGRKHTHKNRLTKRTLKRESETCVEVQEMKPNLDDRSD